LSRSITVSPLGAITLAWLDRTATTKGQLLPPSTLRHNSDQRVSRSGHAVNDSIEVLRSTSV
jgi:hypothetical protein